ncbi:hypothetical protein A5725_12050 [Mycobacterium kubicae]|nr:hypothetical protein A5725_12050 [Mycobacterium kubicae]
MSIFGFTGTSGGFDLFTESLIASSTLDRSTFGRISTSGGFDFLTASLIVLSTLEASIVGSIVTGMTWPEICFSIASETPLSEGIIWRH